MRRTRKWAFVAQEATRLRSLGLSPRAIAKKLDLNKSTVTRWIKSGKLTPARARSSASVQPGQTPAQWAETVRKSYDLDATDEQLVTVAESALELSRDRKQDARLRMMAAGRFQGIVKQLALVARAAERQPPEEVKPKVKVKPTPLRMARHAGGDPRVLLMAVK